MNRSNVIPDRYESHQRPDDPSLFGALLCAVCCPIAAAAFSIPFLVCAYIIIALVNQKLPDFNAYKTYWHGAIWLGGIGGFLGSMLHYGSATREVEQYEQGYREWQAQQEQERQEAARREAQEAELRRLARLHQEREQALDARRRRVVELETMVLRAQAQHAVETDFFGTGNPAPLLANFRQHLGKLAVTDLGVLRESQHPVVREIVGDGLFLPPAPPLRLPSINPA